MRAFALLIMCLSGCSQSVEIRAQGSHTPPGGGEPVQWVARYCATK